MHSRNWFCSWEAGRSGSRRRRQRRLWMSPRPSPSQTQAPRTGCSPQQDNHTARCTHRFSPQAVYAHLEDSGRKADVTLAGGGLPARKRTARPRLTRMWSTWARRRRWMRGFRWGYDERPRHNSRTDRVLDLLQRNSTGGIFNRHCYNLSYVSRSESALAPAEIKSPRDRSMERARGIRLRLGGSASLFEPFPSKPKGMWSKTYQRLRDRSERDEMVHWRQLVERHRLSGM